MTDSQDAIRENIAETRERLSSTIEEIGDRLNPQTLKDNVTNSIREATIGRVSTMARNAAESVNRTTTGVTSTIRDNPIPAAMVAAGLGWMIWNARAASEQRAVSSYGPPNRDAYDVGYGDEYGAAYTGEQGRTLGEQSKRAAARAKQTAGDVTERARQMADTVADTTRRQATRVEDSFRENPLVLGAVAMAVGLAAGLAVPVSDREIRLMGDARDQFVDHAKDVAGDVREKAERVVSRVVDDTKQVAREEGLTT